MSVTKSCLPNAKRLQYVALGLLIVGSLVGSGVKAKEPTDSLSVIKAALPDSVSLDSGVTYVDFWASWCLPCKQSFPWMQEMYDKYHKQGLNLVAICVDKDHSAALQFLKDSKATFTVLFDSTGALAKQYKLKAMPVSYLYDSAGHLVMSKKGFRKEETEAVKDKINQLLLAMNAKRKHSNNKEQTTKPEATK